MSKCSIVIGAPSNLLLREQLEFLDKLDVYAEKVYGTYFGYHRIPVNDFLSGFGWLGDFEFNNEYDSKQLLKYAETLITNV